MFNFRLFAVLGVICSVIVVSCSQEASSKPNFIFKKAPTQGIALRFLDKNVTESELFYTIETKIYEAEMEVYNLKMNQIRSHVLKALMNNDPKKKDLTNDEYLDKYIAKNTKVSAKQINDFIKQRNIPSEHVNDQLKERVKQYLLMEEKKVSIEKWIASKTKKNPVEVYITKPQRPVRDVNLGDAPFLGNKDAKVTLVEFSDFQCPFCAKGATLLKDIKKKYGNKVKIVFKNFPLPNHSQAQKAAESALCAREQKEASFWKMHDMMFENQTKLAVEELHKMAEKLKLDVEKFKNCLSSSKYATTVANDKRDGEKAGVQSTPTFFVNGKMISGVLPMDVFTDLIDQDL